MVDQQPGRNRVYALHPDGMSVQLTAMTGGGGTPALTVAQLRAMALDDSWSR